MFGRLCRARIITTLDHLTAYHLIRIQDSDKYKTTFHTQSGQFKFPAMLCGLANRPAPFQPNIDDCLQPCIDDIVVGYLNDILIYPTNEEDHKDRVWKVLEWLQKFILHANDGKCHFGVTEVCFGGLIISPNAMGMEWDRM